MELSAAEAKRALRRSLLRDRAAMMAAHAGSARLAIRDRYLTAFEPPPGTVVSAFWPMPGELDLRPLLEAVHARGCVCALPVVVARHAPLVFRAWEPGVTLVTSRFGIAEPGPERAGRAAAATRWCRCSRSTMRATASAMAAASTTARWPRCATTGRDRSWRSAWASTPSAVPSLPREPFDERLDWLRDRGGRQAGLKTRDYVRA